MMPSSRSRASLAPSTGSRCLGRIEEEVRLPLLPVTPATGKVIREAMVFAGLLNA